jgi:hypothetical protein
MSRSPLRSLIVARRAALVATGLVALGGCSMVTTDESTFFADPARYDLYDCKQLGDVRTQLTSQVDELARLMAKAETGTGGAVVSELAYRPDYMFARGNLKLVNRVWDDNRCDSQIVSTGSRRPISSLPSNASGGRVY